MPGLLIGVLGFHRSGHTPDGVSEHTPAGVRWHPLKLLASRWPPGCSLSVRLQQ